MATGQDDVRTSTIAIVGLIGAIAVFAVIVLLMVIYYHVAQRVEQETVIQRPFAELESALAEQRAKLVEYRKVGEVEEGGVQRGVYRIPIERAMSLVLEDLRAGRAPVRAPAVGQAPGGPEGGVPEGVAARDRTLQGHGGDAGPAPNGAAETKEVQDDQ